MPERRLLWPLLAYGALSVAAFVRRGETRRPGGERRVAPGAQSHDAGQSDEARAREHGRGRHAAAPWDIPWRGWKDIFWRTYEGINDDRLLLVAAGVVFYSLLALFPAIAAFVSLYGLFADPGAIDARVSMLSGMLPGGALDVLHGELRRLAANKASNLSIGFIVGLLFALWSANAAMKSIIDALNVAYGEKERRSFIRLNLVSLLYTLIAMVSLMLAVGAVVVAPIALGALGLGGVAVALIAVLRWPVVLALGRRRPRGGLSLSTLPSRAALAVAHRRKRRRRGRVARQLVALLLVHRQFRPLQRHLRLARGGRRHDDVDVDLDGRHSGRRPAERRNRASDRARLTCRARAGPRRPSTRAGTGAFHRIRRPSG